MVKDEVKLELKSINYEAWWCLFVVLINWNFTLDSIWNFTVFCVLFICSWTWCAYKETMAFILSDFIICFNCGTIIRFSRNSLFRGASSANLFGKSGLGKNRRQQDLTCLLLQHWFHLVCHNLLQLWKCHWQPFSLFFGGRTYSYISKNLSVATFLDVRKASSAAP